MQPTEPKCEDCRDRGFVIEPDGGNGRARRCPCSIPTLEQLMIRAGIPADYMRYTRENYPGRWPVRCLAGGERADLSLWPEKFHTVFIAGNVGSGKTHITTALLVEQLKAGVKARWWDMGNLLEEMKAAMADESLGAFQRELQEIPVLLLDDLGARHRTQWTDFQVAHVLRQRIARNKPTLITSTVPLVGSRVEPGIAEMDAGLASRLQGQILVDRFEEPDHRMEGAA